MFYSRPKCPQLGWDLEALPDADDGINYEAKTTDGRDVCFQYKRAWLTVYEGKDCENEIFSTDEINSYRLLPEQICDILGITVRGQKVAPTPEQIAEQRGMVADLSGATTYWSNWGKVESGVSEIILQSILKEIPHTCLLKQDYDINVFYPLPAKGNHGNSFMVGVVANDAKYKSMLLLMSTKTELHSKPNFSAVINFNQHSRGVQDRIEYMFLKIDAETKTDDLVGMQALKKLETIIEKHFQLATR